MEEVNADREAHGRKTFDEPKKRREPEIQLSASYGLAA